MILSLAIAWCLLSVPFGVVVGMSIRQGVHGDAATRHLPAVPTAGPVRAASDERPGPLRPGVPQQRRPERQIALQDAS